MLYLLQQVLNGVHSGAIYALLAFGYVLTNGVLHRTNFAYGPLFAFAGQTMILAATFGWQVLFLDLPATILFGIVAAAAYSALASAFLARSVLQPLAVRAPDAIVVATLGAALFLMELSRLAAGTKELWLPPLLATPIVLAAGPGFKVTLTVIQLLDCAVAGLALAIATGLLARLPAGRRWRAVRDDPLAAAMCGVDTGAVFRGTVLAGAMTAALAGMLAALYYGNMGFDAGLVFGLKVLFVTAAGSYRSPPLAAVGGFAFGLLEALWSGYFPLAWRDAWIFLFLTALLQLRRERDATFVG